MSFVKYCRPYQSLIDQDYLRRASAEDIERILGQEELTAQDFLLLLSPVAGHYLEAMAQKAHQLSVQHFGKAILLYTPMYLANYCVNQCAYCSFNARNKIKRKKLTLAEIEAEARAIAQTGLRHILLLTGESKKESPVSYLGAAVQLLKKYFHSIAVEIYPLTVAEYRYLVEAGVDGLTIYQEVYDEKIYAAVHPAGPKRDYHFRLEAPARGCQAGMRFVNIGALLGLNDWRQEAFWAGQHGRYLQERYPEAEISISLPRIRPHKGSFEQVYPLTDAEFVQIMLAIRIFLPRVGITISTREAAHFRDNLIPLGMTKMSAGVSTGVGGHSAWSTGEEQFAIADPRNVADIKAAVLAKGYQPIFKDWLAI